MMDFFALTSHHKELLSILIFIIPLFKRSVVTVFILRVFFRTFFQLFELWNHAKIKALQIWSDQCCWCSDQCYVRVYSCPVVFHKRVKPDVSLVSLQHKRPANKWIHAFIAHPQKTCSPILQIIGGSFLKQKNNTVQKPSYYKVLDQPIYLNHSWYAVLYIPNFPLPTPWFINDTFW